MAFFLARLPDGLGSPSLLIQKEVYHTLVKRCQKTILLWTGDVSYWKAIHGANWARTCASLKNFAGRNG